MTPAAQKIIHPDALWFATGKKPILELTGETEHVFFCGKVTDPADLLLISPCTANTLSKMAHGIDDTAVTTFATTAIGAQHPVLVVPAMHQSMYDHPMIQRNITDLNKLDHVSILEPVLERNGAGEGRDPGDTQGDQVERVRRNAGRGPRTQATRWSLMR